jgi:hypothetical protein
MSSESPVVELYSSDGYEVSAQNNVAIPTGTRGVISLGSDGTTSRFILIDGSARQVIVGAGTAGTSTGGVLSIQGVAGGVAIPVSSTQADATATGALGALNAAVQIATAGYSSVGFQLAAGTLVGTLVAEVSFDGGTTWNSTYFNDSVTSNNTATVVFASANPATAKTIIEVGGSGLTRVRVSAYTSGTANITLRASTVRDPSTLNAGAPGSALPPVVNQVGGSVTTAAPTYTTATMNALSLTTAGALRIDGSSTTQPISGTVTANQGTANTLANAWSTKITDATNGPVAVKAASTAAVAADPSLVTAFSPNSPLPTGTNSIGTVNQGTAASLANAWSAKITDGTNGPAAVKAASTAAVAADPALVVAISPNNSLTISTADTTGTGTLNALNATAAVALAGHSSVGFQLLAGTLIGTIVPEISMDGGTTWVTTFFDDPVTGNSASSIVFGVANGATTRTIAGAGGASNARVRVSAFTSGTATCNIRASLVADPSLLSGGAAGAALPPVIGQVGGSVTTAAPTYTTGTLNAISLTTAGAIRIDGSAVTQPVSGTVTVQQATAASLNATIVDGQTVEATAAWVTGTAINSTLQQNISGYGTATITLNQGTTLTGGVVTFEASDTVAGTNWYPIAVTPTVAAVPSSTYAFVASTNIAFQVGVGAFVLIRARLSTTITGTGTVNVGIAANAGTADFQEATYITDGSHGPVAVKAASVAAVATDPALVVAISPNSNTVSTSGTADITATGALGALNANVQLVLAGHATSGFQLAAGTLIGTIVAETSFDGGTTWNSTYIDQLAGNKVSSIVFAVANTATASTMVGVGGTGLVRVRVSAYTSGTANITLRASVIADPSTLTGGNPNSTVQPPDATQLAGWDGTTLRVPSVKAASTSAVAADQALVVAISPNTVVNPDTVATGALGALNAAVTVNCSGLQTIGIQVAAGTLAGTILPEFSWDGGTTYSPGYFIGPASLGAVATLTFTNPNPAQGKMIAVIGGAGLVRVRVSAYTSGTCNVTVRASEVIAEFVGLAGAQTGAAVPPMVLQVGGSDGTNIHTLSTSAINGFNPLMIQEADPLTASSYPDQGNYVTGINSSSTYDAFGNLQVRGPVFTDEGSLRDDFTGTTLTTAITGNLTFTNGSLTVTGTNLQAQIRTGQYIKKTADAETLYVQVASVDTSTSLTLVTAYAGTSAAAASVVSNWQTVTPTSGTGAITVATSIMTMGCGTTANGTGSIRSLGDYLPYSIQFYTQVSQRIVNQTLYMGVQDVVGITPNQQASVQFSGTVNTTVNFVTCFANTAADTQTVACTIPNGGTTATYHLYKIDLSSNQATLSIDGVVVATNIIHLPSPYTNLFISAGVVNGAVAPASNTNFQIDYVFFENTDRVQIDTDFIGEPLPVLTQQAYGVSNQTITITLNSLTNTSARQSTAVNNSATVFRDVLVQIVVTTAAAAVSATGITNVYAYASSDGGTTYGDTATGINAAVTLTSPPNLKLIGTINTVANATTYDSNPMSVAAVFGGKLPQFWGIVVENKSGATFNATAGNFKAFFQGVTG